MRLLFAKVVESDPTYWSGSHLILIYQADALQDQKLLEGTLQNLEKYFSGKEVREAIVCYQAGKGKPDTSLLDYLVASCSGFFGFSHHEPMIPRSAVDELVETISRDRSRAMSAFLKGHLRNLQAGGNAYADFDTYAKRAMAFEQQFHALVNSVRFKVGRNICEFAKSVKQKDFRTARAIAGWSLRWAWRRTTGYEKRIARKSKLPTVSLHNNIARTQISEAVPAENLRYRKATIDCGAVSNLVSVVLPVYNHKKFLGDSIRSVLRQQYANLELIIVNDGSTEDLDSVLQEFASDPRVRYVRHRVNQRLPNALNTGFRFARGEFHTWTSADNLMEEHCLEGLVRFLRENPQHDMVFSGFQLIDHDGKTIPSWTGHEGGKVYWNQDTWLLNSTFNFVGAAFLYRHHAARAVGLYSTLFSGAEDYDYWMRLNNFFSIARHPDPNFAPYHYRFHHDSLTGNARAMRLEQFVARLKAIDRLRQGISVAPIDFILMSSEPELLKLQEDVIDCSIRSKPCKGPLPALIPDVKLVLRTAASQTQSSRSDLQHVNPFRDLATVQGLFLTGEEHIDNETLSKMIDAADFVILGSRDLLETVHHKRRFYINPLDRSAEFITALVRSIVSERLTDLHFDRTIPIDQGFEAKV